jgi:hypothetical protein
MMVLAGASLLIVGIPLLALGAVGQFEVGVRADATGAVGSIHPGFVALLVLGGSASVAGALILYGQYHRLRTSRA